MNPGFSEAQWINPPKSYQINEESVRIETEPQTDFWQRSYCGFRNDNAPALLLESDQNFTLTALVEFDYNMQFDQCGLIIYLDDENWFKASVEYENDTFSRLGCVITNLGYSDWLTTDILTPTSIWYHLSRRGPDFLIESSLNGEAFHQMRIFHLHKLGDTTDQMGKSNPPLPASQSVRFGLYACSPGNASFTANFSRFSLDESLWKAH
jgi:regulation of enolase protein 1 (concanavalin A-like superfamily)